MAAYLTYKAAQATYKDYATNYELVFFHHKSDINHFMRRAATHPNDSVLDLGTGTGWIAAAAKEITSGIIVGVDANPEIVQEATRQHGTLKSPLWLAT